MTIHDDRHDIRNKPEHSLGAYVLAAFMGCIPVLILLAWAYQ